jgi:hypothetical protein
MLRRLWLAAMLAVLHTLAALVTILTATSTAVEYALIGTVVASAGLLGVVLIFAVWVLALGLLFVLFRFAWNLFL